MNYKHIRIPKTDDSQNKTIDPEMYTTTAVQLILEYIQQHLQYTTAADPIRGKSTGSTGAHVPPNPNQKFYCMC